MRQRPIAQLALAGALVLLAAAFQAPAASAQTCVQAEVVALDQPWAWNRYGALQPQGMIYALREDVVHADQVEDGTCRAQLPLVPGEVRLREGKRPRPLVLRVNEGECLEITLHNMLHPELGDTEQWQSEHPNETDLSRFSKQPATRDVSIHVIGLEYGEQIRDGGMNAGANGPAGNGLVAPGNTIVYKLHAREQGQFLMYSGAAMVGGEGDGGTISNGLFGAVVVEPPGARYFRSQISRDVTDLVTTTPAPGPGPTPPHPVWSYTATFGTNDCRLGYFRKGKSILEMRHAGRIIYSDLTAIITGPGLGGFGPGYLPSTEVYPDRNEPFREYVIIFHDEVGALQAFPEFEDPVLSHTLHSARDAFAFNYGTGGIGAEILANRLGVGPAWDCAECKYEEFFLTSWAVGDPAMVVDIPANAPCSMTARKEGTPCTIDPGPKADRELYPDDPSNVYHSYLNDRVIFRNLHAGTDDHHIFHLHAHQWLHSPKSDDSAYMDSQAIGQGASYVYEIAYRGSGNRNKTQGDSIFHCHFYPHFAQGMWALWRVHDVLELGTELDEEGKPVHTVDAAEKVHTQTRALPDQELTAGALIPGVVPLPGKPMAPLPAPVFLVDGQIDRTATFAAANANKSAGRDDYNPGYPFYIPGRAGRRPPHPPLDTIYDGGLERHVVRSGFATSVQTRLDFTKNSHVLDVEWLPEAGTPLEDLAMSFHEQAGFTTPDPQGSTTGKFDLNGLLRIAGAPYADPCSDLVNGVPVAIGDARTRFYHAADIQLDVVFNKAGWHFPQQRMLSLFDDKDDFLSGTRPPEPLFFRAESGECVRFWLTNLVPFEYELDDFQVKTPTDILGQHIHLVKFDVTSSDGSANGWNYEDGSFSPEEVQERICAIRVANECESDEIVAAARAGQEVHCEFLGTPSTECPVPEIHPLLGTAGPDQNCNGLPDYLGAQTTAQRWWADPVFDQDETDRTLHTVFTHDHFGPSTHQQVGLYAGLVIEPAGSTWYHNETGVQLGTRTSDGGPTSWQAVVESGTESKREFALEFGDFQLAYQPFTLHCPTDEMGLAHPTLAINPPGRKSVGPPKLFERPITCPTNDGTTGPPPPCPEAISADDPGMTVVNYRNEPIGLRVRDPLTNQQATGQRGDLSFAYETRKDRADPAMNQKPQAPYPSPLTKGLFKGDPYTPVLRAFEGDDVEVRILVGAHEEEHNFTIHGLEWLREPDDANSGWRNSQMMGISEWFDLRVSPLPNLIRGRFMDLLYKPSASAEFQWTGAWGLMRIYRGRPNRTLYSEPGAATVPWRLGDVTGTAVVAEDPLAGEEFDEEGPIALASNLDLEAATETERDTSYDEVPADRVEALPASEPDAEDGTVEALPMGLESVVAAAGSGNVRIRCPRIGSSGRLGSIVYDVTAVAAGEVLPDQTLTYNNRPAVVQHWDENLKRFNGTRSGPLHDPTAILFVRTGDLDYTTGRPRLKPTAPVEPLILRARAGDCISVVLRNDLPWGRGLTTPVPPRDLDGWNSVPMILDDFNANDVLPSLHVGLHPQLVAFDPQHSDGSNVGLNKRQYRRQTVAPGERIVYFWYAGDVGYTPLVLTPIEYGAGGLSSSDPIKHSNKGAVGALVVEPRGATWAFTDTHEYLPGEAQDRISRAHATVSHPSGPSFREFVSVIQTNVNLRYTGAEGPWDPDLQLSVPSLAVNEDAQESAQKGYGYRTEPIWFRVGHSPNTPPEETRKVDFADSLTNAKVGGDPVTPLYRADPGDPLRFRVVHPAGHTQASTFEVQGHLWQELPYVSSSQIIGNSPTSEFRGLADGNGATNHFDAPIDAAGGSFGVVGDYVYRDNAGWYLDGGLWGLLRIGFEVRTTQESGPTDSGKTDPFASTTTAGSTYESPLLSVTGQGAER